MTIPSAEGFLQASSCLPCTAAEEREVVDELTREAETNVKHGDLRYLVSQSWWMEWQGYVGLVSYGENGTEQFPQVTNRPGEIDNSKLVLAERINGSEEPELQRTLREGEHYTLVPQEVWQRLYEWYKGGPEIPRKVIVDNPTDKTYIVDVYPLCLKLIDGRDSSEKVLRISRKAKVHELYSMVCSLMSVEQSEIVIWDYYQRSKGKKLFIQNETLEEAQLTMDQESVSHAISSLVPDCKIQQDRLLQSHNVLPPSLQEQSASKSKWGFIFLGYSLPQVIKLINYTNHVSDLINLFLRPVELSLTKIHVRHSLMV